MSNPKLVTQEGFMESKVGGSQNNSGGISPQHSVGNSGSAGRYVYIHTVYIHRIHTHIDIRIDSLNVCSIYTQQNLFYFFFFAFAFVLFVFDFLGVCVSLTVSYDCRIFYCLKCGKNCLFGLFFVSVFVFVCVSLCAV